MAIIGITGSHCTGKSTLLADLSSALTARDGRSPFIINWIGSRVVAAGLPVAEKSSVDTYCKFLSTHLEALRVARDHELAFIDRTPFDLLAYALANRNTSGPLLEMLTTVAETVTSAYTSIFYLPIEFPLEPSTYRSSDPRYRDAVDHHLVDVLERLHVPAVRLTGDRTSRLHAALLHIPAK